MMKNIFNPFITLIVIGAFNAQADDIAVKLTGGFDFQAAYFKSNASSKHQYLSPNKKHTAFYTSAYLAVNASNTTEDGLLYGAKIAIHPTTNPSRKLQSGIYTESSFGRLELGSEKSANTKMRITPFSIASATAGLWDVWVKGDPAANESEQIPYIMNYGSFLDSKLRNSGKTEFSRKITYYTPEYMGMQAGISYIPDSSNVGYEGLSGDSKAHTPVYSKYTYSIKDGIAGGLTYRKDFDKGFYTKLSLGGEMGKVKAKPKDNSGAPFVKAKNLKSYNIGGELTYDQYSIAASYGNFMKSFTSSTDSRVHTHLYGVGGRYRLDKMSTSLTYFGSSHRKNTVNATTLGVDYKLAPGLMPYAEVTYFSAKGRKLTAKDDAPKSTHKGTLLLMGAKVEF